MRHKAFRSSQESRWTQLKWRALLLGRVRTVCGPEVPVGSAVPMGTGYAMEPYTVDPSAYAMQGAPVVYSSSPYMASPYTTPMFSNLDHAQGKWFAPGEALPPGFVITAHPEGHTEPQDGHLMSDKARESFVVTGSKLGSAMPLKKSKKSKKKKSSGCC